MILILTIILAPLAVFAFRRSKVMTVALVTLFVVQAAIVLIWMRGWTAQSYFVNHLRVPNIIILDPLLERYLMAAFWIVVAIVFALGVEQIINSFLASEPKFAATHGKLVVVLICEIFLLTLLQFGRVSFVGTAERSAASSTSPSGTREIQLLPMAVFFDTNGVVIRREDRSIIWRSVGEIGDILTDSKGARFVWADHDSRVFLLLKLPEKEYAVAGFDFAIHQDLDPTDWNRDAR